MDIKSGIRERRRNRIRAIQSRLGPGDADGMGTGFGPAGSRQGGAGPAGNGPIGGQTGGNGPIRHQPAYGPAAVHGSQLPPYRDGLGEPMIDPLVDSQWREDESGGGGGFTVGPSRGGIRIKLVICLLLYGLIVGLFQLHDSWAAEAKQYVRAALTDDMPFDAVEAWYRQTFSGAPSLIPAFLNWHKQDAEKVTVPAANTFHTPVSGTVVAPFADGHPYVEIKTKADAPVYAMDAGLIVSAGQQDGAGYSITIQHAGGYQSTYSGLRPGKWEKDDWINAGDALGTVAPGQGGTGLFDFRVMKDRDYVNPADVVSLD